MDSSIAYRVVLVDFEVDRLFSFIIDKFLLFWYYLFKKINKRLVFKKNTKQIAVNHTGTVNGTLKIVILINTHMFLVDSIGVLTTLILRFISIDKI